MVAKVAPGSAGRVGSVNSLFSHPLKLKQIQAERKPCLHVSSSRLIVFGFLVGCQPKIWAYGAVRRSYRQYVRSRVRFPPYVPPEEMVHYLMFGSVSVSPGSLGSSPVSKRSSLSVPGWNCMDDTRAFTRPPGDSLTYAYASRASCHPYSGERQRVHPNLRNGWSLR